MHRRRKKVFSQSDQETRAVRKVRHALSTAHSEALLLQEVVEIIVHDCGYPLAWVAVLSAGTETSVGISACCAQDDESVAALRTETSGCFVPMATLSDNPDQLVGEDCEPWLNIAVACGHQSVASFLIKADVGPFAVLVVHALQGGFFVRQGMSVIAELVEDLSVGVSSIRNRARLDVEREYRLSIQKQLLDYRKLDALGILTNEFATDLNGLLTVIMLETEQLSLEIKEQGYGHTKSVMKSARHAAELASQLGALGRMRVFRPHLVPLQDVAADIAAKLEPLVERGIDVLVELCDEPLLVSIDRLLFEQGVTNLGMAVQESMVYGGQLLLDVRDCDLSKDEAEIPWYVPVGRYASIALSGRVKEASQSDIDDTSALQNRRQDRGAKQAIPLAYEIVKYNNGYVFGRDTWFRILLPIADSA